MAWIVGVLVLVIVVAGGAVGSNTLVHRDSCGNDCFQGGPVSAAAPLDTAQRVGDLTVTVTAVDLTASAEMMVQASAGSRSYFRPVLGEQAFITFTVTNEGTSSRPLLTSFFPYVAGTDGTWFQLDCSRNLERPVNRSTLAPGESATGGACLDVNPSHLQGATVVVRDGQLGAGVSWTTGG